MLSGSVDELDLSTNRALVELDCQQNLITSLNLRGAASLKDIQCHFNQLTELDVSGCTSLRILGCLGNLLEVPALNKMFETLYDNPTPGSTVAIYANPGEPGCDNKGIAEAKGLLVD